MQRAASWLIDKLHAIGMENVELMTSDALLHSVVYADWLYAEGQPTVLIYGHYDVHLVNSDFWNTPPFEPNVENDRVYARGAAYCKGAC